MKKRTDGLYQAQIFLGYDENKKRITKTFYGKTIKEAREKAEDYKRSENYNKSTLKYYADAYLVDCTDGTKKSRIQAFVDSIGKMPIADINAVDLEKILQELAKENPRTNKPTSERTLNRYLAAINQVFEYAERNRIITFNPCKYVRVPKAAPPEKREAITREDISAIENVSHKAVLPAQIMIYAGLRRGELTALTWGDVDLKNNTITVDKAYDLKKHVLKPPKTKAGNRIVPIPDCLVNALKQAKKGKKKSDLVIVNDAGERMTDASWKNFEDGLVSRSGVDFTWHMLRHTYATLCYDAGVDALSCSRWCGHSSPRITIELYTHLSLQKQNESISKLNNLFK